MIGKSKSKVGLPDGIYTGSWGACVVTILSQDHFGKTFTTVNCVKTTNLIVAVIVKNGDANIYDKRISL
jgi:hypothetical protein